MEKLRFLDRRIAAILVASLGALGLSACGQTDPPSPEEFNDKVEYIILDGVTAENGEPVRCAMYGSESSGTNDSKSWFGFDCDYEGTAVFPDEVNIVNEQGVQG